MIALKQPAQIFYGDGNFDILSSGSFVHCAVSGAVIPLEELKYWSVDRQEAYASAELALLRSEGKS